MDFFSLNENKGILIECEFKRNERVVIVNPEEIGNDKEFNTNFLYYKGFIGEIKSKKNCSDKQKIYPFLSKWEYRVLIEARNNFYKSNTITVNGSFLKNLNDIDVPANFSKRMKLI